MVKVEKKTPSTKIVSLAKTHTLTCIVMNHTPALEAPSFYRHVVIREREKLKS